MVRLWVTTIAVSLFGALSPAVALQAADTMKVWKSSSAEERSNLLNELLGEHGAGPDTAEIRKCLDKTSAIPDHSDLEISEVVRACKSSKGAGECV